MLCVYKDIGITPADLHSTSTLIVPRSWILEGHYVGVRCLCNINLTTQKGVQGKGEVLPLGQ